jgi:hypothetical protein
VSSKYEFIDGMKAQYPIVKMCDWLSVSKSGFYEWRGRPLSATAERRVDLVEKIKKIFNDSRQTYGHRRVHAHLTRDGVPAGEELVRQVMRELGLEPCQPRAWRVTTVADGTDPIEDRLERDFTASAPGERFVGDITYIRTWAGWLYLATVIDLCTKEVVGWSMADHMRASLPCDALCMAVRNGRVRKGAIFHSDRGSQGGINRSSQHLECEELRWESGSVRRRSGQCAGRCGRPVDPRQRVVRTGWGFGMRLPAARRVRTPRPRSACHPRLGPGGSEKVVACEPSAVSPCQVAICPLPSEKRLQSCGLRAVG